ncbi:MAG: hypothetical protein A3J79_14865 [Elusimicrobia bacterium RIFOXYB2_FULL_62_6]|nr:MAG: hypothetical protein A3J79_14865 [Elusimicrobia bacterium RIFOXYB2_FULL_62_6]
MKLRAKPLVAGTLFVAGAFYLYYPNPFWPTSRLLGALERKDDLHRLIAAGELGSRALTDPERVIPGLIPALGDRWDEVGGSVSASLCRAGAPAVPHLRRALLHENARVREMAGLTLECLKAKGLK